MLGVRVGLGQLHINYKRDFRMLEGRHRKRWVCLEQLGTKPDRTMHVPAVILVRNVTTEKSASFLTAEGKCSGRSTCDLMGEVRSCSSKIAS